MEGCSYSRNGKVHRMVNIRNSLVIFADNGVDISGSGADEGFSATGYQVKRYLL